jgi:outer membrane murein-binding lipoprotein Lpp
MLRETLMAVVLCAPMAVAADDYKVNQLEQDVRELQRQVQVLSRQLESQHLQPAAPGDPPRLTPAPPTVMAGTPVWVDAAKWKRLKTGMSELEVVSSLGPPTSMRAQEGQRVLWYALEIGSSGFLSGSVTLRDRIVVAIQTPVLQ